MYIETVSQRVVAICLPKEEMESRGVSAAIGPCSARDLVRQVLREAGQEPWKDMEIELFARDGDVLIMARPAVLSCALFSFPTGEILIQAALVCPPGLPACLFADGERYYLALRCAESGAPPVLYEYGEPVPQAERRLAYLREHGVCLIGSGAVDALKAYFG